VERLTVAGVTEVLIGAGLPTTLLPVRGDRRQVALLTQPPATSRALELAGMLRQEGLVTEVIGVPDRDEAKTLEVAASVYEALARMRLGRHDTVVGVGGGSVTDLAGFVAGTWLRGVEAVFFPTTYLASIDAAIGGKTGVNIGGKNLVGVFWHPTRVVIDTDGLARLPSSLVREGLAEAYKAGLVGDPALARLLAERGHEAPVTEVVSRALAVKAGLVSTDPTDRAERAFLNFGHTLGHAVEFASTLSHGESVAVGMVAASRISEARAGFGAADVVVATLTGLGLPTSVRGLDRSRVRDLVRLDKKRDQGGDRMVLLRDIGDPFVASVDEADVDLGLSSIGL
jgi:3-dehydroquinate synthase